MKVIPNASLIISENISNKSRNKHNLGYLNPAIDIIIGIMFAILPILDSLNGYLLRNNHVSIGPVYHVAYALLFMVFTLLKTRFGIRKKPFISMSVALFSFFITICLNQLFDANSVLDYSRAVKCLVTYIYIACFFELLEGRPKLVFFVLDYTSLAIPIILILLRVTHLGYNYYSGGTSGYVGWYSSLDELNAILVVLLLYTVISFDATDIKAFLRLVLLSICMILVSSKASLIMLILIMACLFIGGLIELTKNHKINKKTALLIIIFIAAVMYVVIPVIDKIYDSFVSRQRYLYLNKTESGLLSYISTGRVDRFEELIITPFNNLRDGNIILKIVRVLFGNGFMHYSYYGASGEIHFEMDMFDSYYWMGFMGVASYIYIFVLFWRKMRKTQSKTIKYFAYFILLFVSFFIGHILYAGVASIYFCFMIASMSRIDLSKENKNRCQRNLEL